MGEEEQNESFILLITKSWPAVLQSTENSMKVSGLIGLSQKGLEFLETEGPIFCGANNAEEEGAEMQINR